MQDNQEERAIFATTMYGIAEDFGGTLSNDNLRVRFMALQEFSINQITKAGTWLLRNREATFPAVPTTKEFIDAINISESISPKLKAEIEADKVIGTLKEWGRDAEALFYDEITKYLMTKRWTFRQLDTMHVDDPGLKWWRKDFVQAYHDIEHDKKNGHCMPEITGKPCIDIQKLADSVIRKLP